MEICEIKEIVTQSLRCVSQKLPEENEIIFSCHPITFKFLYFIIELEEIHHFPIIDIIRESDYKVFTILNLCEEIRRRLLAAHANYEV